MSQKMLIASRWKVFSLCLFCLLLHALPSNADVFCTTSYFLDKKQSNKFIYETSSNVPASGMPYSALQSTIYQPFATSMQERSESKFINLNVDVTGYGLISPSDPEPPEEPNDGPVGEGWCLLVYAAIAALVVFVRQQRKNKLATKDE